MSENVTRTLHGTRVDVSSRHPVIESSELFFLNLNSIN